MKTVLKSFSKQNLSLRVFQIETNGLHPISSIFQEISLCDVISISGKPNTAASLNLTSSGIPIPLNQDNILVSLFESMKDELTHDYKILVHNNIPTGSGMGGAK
jgi:4-diphosphocytidyl-2C-methyl-D-erythritol 2-phosphate synthase